MSTRTYVQADVICEQVTATQQRFYLQDFNHESQDTLPGYVIERFERRVRVFQDVTTLTQFLIGYPCVISKLDILPLAG